MRTDWSHRKAEAYANLREDGAHTPGPTPAAIRMLIDERDIRGFGTESISTDAGQGGYYIRLPIPPISTCTAPANTACNAS